MARRERTRGGSGRTVKVVVAGPFNAGKTTMIRTISEITVLSTEREVSDHTRKLKAETTVAMDFGRITVAGNLALYLFGTPGQDRFDFMWEILSEGMLGYVLIVDIERDESIEEAGRILRFFQKVADTPYVIAANKIEGEPDEDLGKQIRKRLDVPDDIRVVPCDARDRESVKNVLLNLLLVVRESITREHELVGEAG